MLNTAHFQSCLNLKEELTKVGFKHDWLLGANESLVTRARNEMAATYLGSEYERLMWIDADIEFSPDDVAALWNLDTDIAVGVYQMKNLSQTRYAAWYKGKLVEDLNQFQDGQIEVDYAGTGFMMIKRHVLEQMIKAYPRTRYTGPHGPVHALFDTSIEDDTYLSEDYFFCKRWRELGGKITMDPMVRLKHWGTYAYGA